MILDLFKRFSMFKFGQFKKNPHFRGVQTYYEEEIGHLGIHRWIFYALSETYYIISGVYPRSMIVMLMENLVGCLNSGTGTPLFCAYKCSKFYKMRNMNLSTVTPEAVAKQKTLVDNLQASLMRRIHSDDFEAYRQRWAQARALLCDMQGALYFSRKEVCHG